jgi:hypothetical protein
MNENRELINKGGVFLVLRTMFVAEFMVYFLSQKLIWFVLLCGIVDLLVFNQDTVSFYWYILWVNCALSCGNCLASIS